MKETTFRLVSIKDRLPNLGKRVLFLDENYKGTFMSEYLPDEKIPLKKGKFIEIKDCKIAQDYLLSNFTHWLERVEINTEFLLHNK